MRRCIEYRSIFKNINGTRDKTIMDKIHTSL